MNDLFDIDWELWIQRKGVPLFTGSLFHEVEGRMLQAVVGAGFTSQLALVDGDEFMFIRRTSDFARIHESVLEFVKTDRREELIKGIRAMPQTSKALMQKAGAYTDEELLEHFAEVMASVNEILLYNTSLPFFILSTLETSESFPGYDEARRAGEEARSISLYHDLAENIFARIFSAVGKNLGITGEEAGWLTLREMQRAISTSQALSAEELHKRQHCLFWLTEEGEEKFIFDPSSMSQMRAVVGGTPAEIVRDTFKGSPAYPGKVTGPVKVINSAAEMDKMQEGDILVAHTTNPNLMYAIKLAGAIVTDEGGIACHAAIVSRELKKPCVIGTRVATQVLKDGDLVEVDADAGIVKILKPA